jgi:Ca-activated chloride channel family protein
VLFTDGVDTASRHANYRNNIEKVEESGAIVYPINYDTEGDQQGVGVYGPTTNPGPSPNPSPPSGRRRPFSPPAGQLSPKWQSPQWRFSQSPGRAPTSGGETSEEYRRAARYLQDLARRSGGRLYDANTLYNIAQAFSNIAEELRHQYSLSYYPTNSKKDGSYRRVKVRVENTGMIVRAREGYRAAAEAQAKSDAGGTNSPEPNRKQ